MKRILALLIGCLVLNITVIACDDESDGDADGDADGDSDGDADGDADGDSDGDGDSDVVHVEESEGCNPLIAEVCGYPYPSMFYLEEDAGSVTGYRAALTVEAMPGTFEVPEEFVGHFNEADGFPIATPWLAIFPEATLDSATLPSVLDLEASVTAQSSVQVFNRETGERIPVWAELDLRGETADQQPLIIRPMRGLPFGTRIAVVITDALLTEEGSPPASPPAFAALRDGRETDSSTIEGWRDRYDELFTFLSEHGVARENVLFAWESVTNSNEFVLSGLVPLVEEAVRVAEASEMTYRIVRCVSSDPDDVETLGCLEEEPDAEEPLSPYTWRRILGTVDVPDFLDEDGYIRLDESGMPVAEGTRSADFLINVPTSLRDAAPGSAPIVVFGHGLLSEPAWYLADDNNSEGQMELADSMGAIFIGTRWIGLSNTEVPQATNVIFDFGRSFTFASMVMQGIVNQLLMPVFAQGALTEEPLLQSSGASETLLDSEHIFYTGISQGGIFGTTFMALSPHVQTGVLHVPGSAYSHMMAHSVDFTLFWSLIEGQVPDRSQQQLMMALVQRLFDAGDPINIIGNIVDEPLTDLGPKNCLWQCSIGDSQATWYGCDMLMRTGGFPIAGPATTDVFGLDVIETPTAPATSAVQQFDPQLGLPNLDFRTPEETGAHTALRRNAEVHLQTIDYLDLDEPGRIVNHCEGPCVIDPVPIPE